MKKFLKNNWLVIIIALVLFGYVTYQVFDLYKLNNKGTENVNQYLNYCKENINNVEGSLYDFCKSIIEDENLKGDIYTGFKEFIEGRLHFLNSFSFIIVAAPVLFYICPVLKKENLKTPSEKLKKAYKYIWILPLLAIYIICALSFWYTFNPAFSLKFDIGYWHSNVMLNPVGFISLYLLNLILYSIFFTNIALIVACKIHSFIPSLIISVLSYVGIYYFIEIVFNLFISRTLFNSKFGEIFNIMNMWSFNDSFGAIALICFSILLCVISGSLVYCCYHKKQK